MKGPSLELPKRVWLTKGRHGSAPTKTRSSSRGTHGKNALWQSVQAKYTSYEGCKGDMSVSSEETDARLHSGGDICYITDYTTKTRGQSRVSDMASMEAFVSLGSWTTAACPEHWLRIWPFVLHGVLLASSGGRSHTRASSPLESYGTE